MMQIEPSSLAGLLAVFISLISLAAWVGALSQKVKGHDKSIEKIHTENREDHQKIFTKLEEVNLFLRNGKPKT
jgi:hypothetical protein